MRGLWQHVCVSILFVGTISACGGASDGPPPKLSKHIEQVHIARIPIDQQGAVVEANKLYSIAQMETANAEANVLEADSQLVQARNDHKATKLAVDSAKAAKKSADQSADMNRMNAAEKDRRGAQESENAARQRVKYFEAWRAYLKKYLRYAQENQYWREAQVEAAKAQIAKSNNIAPKGINLDDFPRQVDSRAKRTQSAKESAEKLKARTVQARQDWLTAQTAADKLTGRTGTLYDPMAPKEGGPTMQGGGVAQEKPEEIKPMTSNPNQPTTPQPTPANTTGGGDGGGGAGAGSGDKPQQ